MARHIQQGHRVFWECKLPGCEGSRSHFQYNRLGAHLFDHHDIRYPTHFFILAVVRGDTSYFSDRAFVTCKYCSELQAQPGQNEVSRDDTS